jgi:succinyl-diaminopimelate desuccinylase
MNSMISTRLEKLVSFYPATSKQAHVKDLLKCVGDQLSELGFKVELLEYNGVHSLYAHPKGLKRSKLLLQGHIDVVPAEGQPFKQDGDKLYGRGVYDMLFATACYIELLNEAKDKIQAMDLGIMLTGDEEYGGFDGTERILADGYICDVCILPDAGEGMGSLNVAAKGVYTLEIRVNGAAHHGSRPWEGDGASAKMVNFLKEVESIFDTSDRQNSTMTIAIIKAGDAENKGPAYADCTLDIRYKDKPDLKRIKDRLETVLNKFDAEVTSVKNGEDYNLDLDNEYVKEFIGLYEKEVGQEVQLTKAYGSSDARFFSSKGVPVIMLRPDGGGAHGDKEWVSEASVTKFYKILKDYVIKIA